MHIGNDATVTTASCPPPGGKRDHLMRAPIGEPDLPVMPAR